MMFWYLSNQDLVYCPWAVMKGSKNIDFLVHLAGRLVRLRGFPYNTLANNSYFITISWDTTSPKCLMKEHVATNN